MPPTVTVPVTEFTTSADGTRIAFERTGSGPVVVLVDGALCSRAFGPGRDVAKAIADRYTVIVYDRRGRGESGDTQPYAVAREVDDLRAVIEEVGGEVFLAGQSSGAALALEAVAAGQKVRALAVYEAPYVGLNAHRDGSPRDYRAEVTELLRTGKSGKAVDYFMTTMVNGPWFLPIMLRAMPKVWKGLTSIAHTLPYDTQVMGATFTPPVERLSAITVPTLVMVGGKSPADMAAAEQAVADAIPGSVHRVLPGQTHTVSAKALASALDEFFTS